MNNEMALLKPLIRIINWFLVVDFGSGDDTGSSLFWFCTCTWGILVKLVICVLPGHWKIKIPKLTKYIDFGCFLVGYITYNEKKVLGHLNLPISPFLVNV